MDNLLGVALQEKVYLFRMGAKEESVLELMTHSDSFYSAIKFSANGSSVAVGDHTGSVNVMDVPKEQLKSAQKHANGKLTCISWMSEHVFSTGCANGEINTIDIRTKNFVSTVKHAEGVCGLAWSSDEPILASGGGDAHVNLWELRTYHK